ncbi:MAG: phosphopyruvate hydratase, partial [Vicinamibacteraceae bacterium]
MPTIENLAGLEVLDSRGKPTVKAFCCLKTGERGEASVPSGASTGRHEAVEQRDGDAERYDGMGCRRAASQLEGVILPRVRGRAFPDQRAFDECLIELDGTTNKSRLGANALLAASLAFA